MSPRSLVSATSRHTNSVTRSRPHARDASHQPRHELEAIAALVGRRWLQITMVYARIADRTVAEECFKVSEKVEALYEQPKSRLPKTEGRRWHGIR